VRELRYSFLGTTNRLSKLYRDGLCPLGMHESLNKGQMELKCFTRYSPCFHGLFDDAINSSSHTVVEAKLWLAGRRGLLWVIPAAR
jgi:hypothetical protein